MTTNKSRSCGPGKTIVTAKIATTDVLAAKKRAAAEGVPLSNVIAQAIHAYGAGKSNNLMPKEPTPA